MLQPSDAELYFKKLSKTDIALQLITYYYALRLYEPADDADDACRYDPNQLVTNVMEKPKCQSTLSDEERKCLNLLQHYYDCLADFIQGQALDKLNFGVDISRFASDAIYKQETILGLSM